MRLSQKQRGIFKHLIDIDLKSSVELCKKEKKVNENGKNGAVWFEKILMHNVTSTQASRQRFVWITHINANADKAFKILKENSCWKTREKNHYFYYYFEQQPLWQGWVFKQQRKIGYCQKLINLRGICVARNTIFLLFNFIKSSGSRDYFSASGFFH